MTKIQCELANKARHNFGESDEYLFVAGSSCWTLQLVDKVTSLFQAQKHKLNPFVVTQSFRSVRLKRNRRCEGHPGRAIKTGRVFGKNCDTIVGGTILRSVLDEVAGGVCDEKRLCLCVLEVSPETLLGPDPPHQRVGPNSPHYLFPVVLLPAKFIVLSQVSHSVLIESNVQNGSSQNKTSKNSSERETGELLKENAEERFHSLHHSYRGHHAGRGTTTKMHVNFPFVCSGGSGRRSEGDTSPASRGRNSKLKSSKRERTRYKEVRKYIVFC